MNAQSKYNLSLDPYDQYFRKAEESKKYNLEPDPYERCCRKAEVEAAIRELEEELRQAKAQAVRQHAQAKAEAKKQHARAAQGYYHGVQAQQTASAREQCSDDDQFAVTFHYADEHGYQLAPDCVTEHVYGTGFCDAYIPELSGYQFEMALVDDGEELVPIEIKRQKNGRVYFTYIPTPFTKEQYRHIYVRYKKTEEFDYDPKEKVTLTFHFVDEDGCSIATPISRTGERRRFCVCFAPDVEGYLIDSRDCSRSFPHYGPTRQDVFVTYRKDNRFWTRLKNGYYNDIIRSIACDVLVAVAVFVYVTNPSWWMNQLWEKYHAEPAAIQEIDPDYNGVEQEIVPIDDGVIVDDAHAITVNITNNRETSADESPVENPTNKPDRYDYPPYDGTGAKDPDVDPSLPTGYNNPLDDPAYKGNAPASSGINVGTGEPDQPGWSTPMTDRYQPMP